MIQFIFLWVTICLQMQFCQPLDEAEYRPPSFWRPYNPYKGSVPLTPVKDQASADGQNSSPDFIKCPDLSLCKHVQGLSESVPIARSRSGTLCIFLDDHTSSCNLSPSGSSCMLKGKFFGASSMFVDDAGNSFVMDC